MDETWGHYAEWNKPLQRTNIMWLHLDEISRVVKIMEIESKMVVVRGWKEIWGVVQLV